MEKVLGAVGQRYSTSFTIVIIKDNCCATAILLSFSCRGSNGVHPYESMMMSFLQIKFLLFVFLALTLGFRHVLDLEWSNCVHSDAFKNLSAFMLLY